MIVNKAVNLFQSTANGHIYYAFPCFDCSFACLRSKTYRLLVHLANILFTCIRLFFFAAIVVRNIHYFNRICIEAFECVCVCGLEKSIRKLTIAAPAQCCQLHGNLSAIACDKRIASNHHHAKPRHKTRTSLVGRAGACARLCNPFKHNTKKKKQTQIIHTTLTAVRVRSPVAGGLAGCNN